jgi:hypothetical protein
MAVEIQSYGEIINLKDVPVGESFQRVSDNQFFFKTRETTTRYEVNSESINTILCIAVHGFVPHRIREDAKVIHVPHTLIKFSQNR